MLGCKGSAALEALPEAGEGGEEAAQVSGEEKDTPVIELRETQEAAVQDAIGYAYSGVLHVRDDNWKELLGAAHAMGMQGAKEFIEAFLRQPGKVNTGNVCDVLSCAQKNSAEGLQEYCMSVIDANSSAVFANAAFTMLPKIVVQELMKRDTLVTDELR